MRRIIALVAVIVSGCASNVEAQRVVPIDSIFARVERLAAAGADAAGRVLIDSVLTASSPTDAHVPVALALKARVAATIQDTEHAYLRIVVEYPTSPQSAIALRSLAQIELAQGNRAAAALHLTRFIRDNPSDPEAGNATISVFRLLSEQNRLAEACAVALPFLASVPASAVELRNQLEFNTARCRGVDTSARARSARSDAAQPATPPTAGRSTPPAANAARFTVQAGAYDTKAEADRVATRLRGLGFEARVVGTRRPFRVHVGRFADRSGADALSRRLTAQRITNFVTTFVPEER